MQIPAFLHDLRSKFLEAGRDLKLVGGSVRDSLLGLEAKDIDLCTDATPDEQLEIYNRYRVNHVPTGLSHGTITVVDPHMHEAFEITSLRIESEHDGRYATVSYTDNWDADLGRRDLTINSMAMSFDGVLYDPYGGREDLFAGRIRFVGQAEDRIQEDYLRILRYFRFCGRFSNDEHPMCGADTATLNAIRSLSSGLKKLSVERIWSEVSRIITGNNGPKILELMNTYGVSEVLGLKPSLYRYMCIHGQTHDAITCLVASQGEHAIVLSERWNMSKDDQRKAVYLVAHRNDTENSNLHVSVWVKRLALGDPRSFVLESMVLNVRSSDIQQVENWVVPVFPLNGGHLLDRGWKPGPAMGVALAKAKQAWVDSSFNMTVDELVQMLD